MARARGLIQPMGAVITLDCGICQNQRRAAENKVLGCIQVNQEVPKKIRLTTKPDLYAVLYCEVVLYCVLLRVFPFLSVLLMRSVI